MWTIHLDRIYRIIRIFCFSRVGHRAGHIPEYEIIRSRRARWPALRIHEVSDQTGRSWPGGARMRLRSPGLAILDHSLLSVTQEKSASLLAIPCSSPALLEKIHSTPRLISLNRQFLDAGYPVPTCCPFLRCFANFVLFSKR